MKQRKSFPKVIQACVNQKTYDALMSLAEQQQIGLSTIIRMWILENLKHYKHK